MENRTVTKIGAALLAAIAELSGMIPGDIRTVSITALCFILLDVFLGFIVACRNGKLASRLLQQGLLRKLLVYVGLILFFLILGFAAGSAAWALAGWGAVCACEGTSILENLTILIRQAEAAGANLGAVSRVLEKIEPIFAHSPKTPDTAIPNPKDDAKETASVLSL